MGGRDCGRSRGAEKPGSPGIRRFHAQIHGGRKLGGSCVAGKMSGGSIRKLGARGGRIEGPGGQIEEGENWILVRGRHIEHAGLRIDSNGKVYAPDSEDEGANLEVEDVAAKGAAAVEVPLDMRPTVAVVADWGPGREVAADLGLGMEMLADGAPSMELAPEVQARLEVVLAGIEPVYHGVFTSIYKVMVPAFFKSD